MSTVVRFSPELGHWLVQRLDQGEKGISLQQIMTSQGMDAEVARVIVDAFVDARSMGSPMPVDTIEMLEASAEYLYETPLLRPGASINTTDGRINILARAEKPVMALLSGVISPDECAQLIELARPRLQPSTIVDPVTGNDVVADHRSSLGMFFRLEETPFIARLDRRIAEIMNLPLENGEGLQILHYPAGALSALHYDFLVPSNPANQTSISRSGQRVSTLVSYLNEVESGGETVFPEAGWSITPRQGNAVYFEYSNRHGQVDHRSLHGSSPVLRGEKWVASKWMRRKRFLPASAPPEG